MREAIAIGQEHERVDARPSHADPAGVLNNRIDRCPACLDGDGGNSVPEPLASATRIAHGASIRFNGDCGVPPTPGCRRNASLFPSGDHIGIESRDVDGATNRIARPGENNPMKLWSARSDTNARV